MPKTRLVLLLIVITPLSVAGNKWNVTFPGGQMRFQGDLIAEACSVETGDRQLIVHMGRVSSNRFKAAGDDADPIPFALHLQDCSTYVSKRINIIVHGVTDGKNPDVLSVGEGEGIASGVSIALFDDYRQIIPVNAETEVGRPLINGSHVLQFVAKYRSTGNRVIGGTANAQAWFSLTYQ